MPTATKPKVPVAADEKKVAPKKATTKKKVKRERKPAIKMTAEVRAAGAAALAAFEEKLLEFDNIGFNGASTRELKGNRSGLIKGVRFGENGNQHRATLTVVYR